MYQQHDKQQGVTAVVYGAGFMAPEVYLGRPYSYPSDVYAWAATMYAMLTHNWRAPVRLQQTDLFLRNKIQQS